MARIAYFTAVSNTMNGFRKAMGRLSERKELKAVLHVSAADNVDLKNETLRDRFLNEILSSDLLIIRLMGGMNSFILWKVIKEQFRGDIFIVPAGETASRIARKGNTLTGENGAVLARYTVYGGEENYYRMLLFLGKLYGGGEWDVPPPERLAADGIYHPDFSLPPSKEEFQKEKIDRAKPTAGVWFHRGNWANGNLAVIDEVIRACERAGMNAYPLFLSMGSGPDGALSPAEAAEHYYDDESGEPLVDVLINLMMFSQSAGSARASGPGWAGGKELWYFSRKGIPVFQGILSNEEEIRWESTSEGLNPVTITLAMALPELDGNIIAHPVGFKERSEQDGDSGIRKIVHAPNKERIASLVSLAANHARLRKIPAGKKRVAVLFHNHPPRNDTIGGAYLLDSPASVVALAERLKEEGYGIDGFPEGGDELMAEIRKGLTNDSSWLTGEQIYKRAADVFSGKDFNALLSGQSEIVKKQLAASGLPEPEDFPIPGKEYGNLFIGIQPGREELHDPDAPADYTYIAYYWWLRRVWKADALIHVGRHGSVEWLYGKGAGLSRDCYTDICLGDIPHFYIYVVNAPGEGTQAKRRGHACLVDHNVPPMDRAGRYGTYAELMSLADEYGEAEKTNPARCPEIRALIAEKAAESDLNGDLDGVSEKDLIRELRERLDEIANTQVRDGLHIFGSAPDAERMASFLVRLTSLGSDETPSLRTCLEHQLGTEDEETLYKSHLRLLKSFQSRRFEAASIGELLAEANLEETREIRETLKNIARFLVPALMGADREMDSLLAGLAGKAVPAGISGAPTRGGIDALPTGKNFYSLDPRILPSKTAWETGKRLADSLLDRYRSEYGDYPANLGIVLWCGPAMRTRGDDIAEVLYLMGVKPVWNGSNGWVTDLSVISLEELGRPRVDVTCKISGLFRDALPAVIALIDKAVRLVALLDEPTEMNPLAAAHPPGGLYRVFGPPPGAYGAGVNKLIDTGKWQSREDLADRYLAWGGYAYTPEKMGVEAKREFRQRLASLDGAVKNQDHRESDFMDSDDWYDYHGGMIAASGRFGGRAPASYMGDSSSPGNIKTRSTGEEAKLVFRTRILNPKWIDAMKRHGYKGALDVSRTLDNAFGWDAVNDVMEDWMYDRFAEAYALDRETREWLEQVNPDSLHHLLERMFEAEGRGMWQANEKILEQLKDLYLESEKKLEDYHDS